MGEESTGLLQVVACPEIDLLRCLQSAEEVLPLYGIEAQLDGTAQLVSNPRDPRGADPDVTLNLFQLPCKALPIHVAPTSAALGMDNASLAQIDCKKTR
jgi:hypothetical protein